jgi:hypothetical protein
VAAVAAVLTVFVDVIAARLLAKHTVAMSIVIVVMWLAVYALTTWQVVHCPDLQVIAYGRAVRNEIAAMAAADAVRCHGLVFGSDDDIDRALPKELTARTQDAVADCIDAASAAPVPAPAEQETAAPLQRVYASVRKRHGGEILAALESAGSETPDVERSCRAVVAMYDEVLALPPRQSGVVLRQLLGERG